MEEDNTFPQAFSPLCQINEEAFEHIIKPDEVCNQKIGCSPPYPIRSNLTKIFWNLPHHTLPLRWGRVRVGVDKTKFGPPSPSSSPARGEEIFRRL